jgi:DNA polymerase
MSSLAERAHDCQRCALAATRQRVVLGSGRVDAAVALVGEAPGRSEDEGGEPFIGPSGRLLFQLVESELGLTRDECFVTNVVKCRPPANRTPRRAEIEACRPWWLEQLAALRASVIVTLGNTATRAVLETTEPIGRMRGRPIALGQHTVVATYHPAAALRAGPSVVEMMREDLQIARAVREGRWPTSA